WTRSRRANRSKLPIAWSLSASRRTSNEQVPPVGGTIGSGVGCTSPWRGEVGPRQRAGRGWQRFRIRCTAVIRGNPSTPPRTAFGSKRTSFALPLQGRVGENGHPLIYGRRRARARVARVARKGAGRMRCPPPSPVHAVFRQRV